LEAFCRPVTLRTLQAGSIVCICRPTCRSVISLPSFPIPHLCYTAPQIQSLTAAARSWNATSMQKPPPTTISSCKIGRSQLHVSIVRRALETLIGQGTRYTSYCRPQCQAPLIQRRIGSLGRAVRRHAVEWVFSGPEKTFLLSNPT